MALLRSPSTDSPTYVPAIRPCPRLRPEHALSSPFQTRAGNPADDALEIPAQKRSPRTPAPVIHPRPLMRLPDLPASATRIARRAHVQRPMPPHPLSRVTACCAELWLQMRSDGCDELSSER
ncbi:hypothetical protein C8R44DRAFT_895189 [Mycena epipterygia]|nr:hypothetical protein C8R44DRAFT_895189 [Mycena epipterygia]